MRIAKLETYVLEARLDKPIQFGIGPYGAFTATLVELTTDDGITGIGECIARRAPRVTDTVVRDLLWPVLEGRDPRDAGGIWDEMFTRLRGWGHYRGFVQEAMSGVDQALWDIVAQAQGVPLYKALGGAGRDRIPVYASSVYIADLDTMQRETREQVEKGHTALKTKVGRTAELGGLRMDIESVRAVREAAGPAMEIGIDVNSAYDAATAIRFCGAVERYDITFIEEPVYPDDIDGYEQIRRHTTIGLACGESEFGIFGFRELLRRRAIDIVQPDIARVGGFTGGMRLGALVLAHNVRYAPHTGFSCGVAQLATLHLAAAVPALWKSEHMFIWNPLRDIFEEPFPEPRDGLVDVPKRLGMGLTVDRKKMERFRLR
ncbi:MAG: mandelate racemase/muconate lactonizing enzyme family protein [Candidatus Rokubacteria bacterium]|nr:mandelate racemase/muconate lactonizing enzyme family protein [Candidatus Rokubacteria bacterium]